MAGPDDMQDLFTRIYESLNSGDPAPWSERLADDVLGIGSDPDEWWEGKEVVARVASAQVEQMSSAGIRIEGGSPRVFGDGDVLWAADRPTVVLSDGTSTPMRFTLVATRQGDQLLMNHFHLSVGAGNADVLGQELPTD